ncbi:unannotated protein [freshwater metagenome]|uniref:Unannotated protein n=1 Tax=freshwater metagenome TaxID=449393 RepID=A0A6J7E7T8_9ZZZZ
MAATKPATGAETQVKSEIRFITFCIVSDAGVPIAHVCTVDPTYPITTEKITVRTKSLLTSCFFHQEFVGGVCKLVMYLSLHRKVSGHKAHG